MWQLRRQRPPRSYRNGLSDSVGDSRRDQPWIGGQDLLMELLKHGPGLDAEFVMQTAARISESSQRVRLTADSVQRQHELAMQALAQWVLSHEVPQLRDQVGVNADRQVELDALLEHADA